MKPSRSMAFPSRVRLLLLLCVLSTVLAHGRAAAAGPVFEVRPRFWLHGGGRGGHFIDLLKHDARRHGRGLFPGIHLPIGGDPSTETGLYFTEVAIGTPAAYFLQVDNWLNSMISHDSCPRKSSLELAATGKAMRTFAHCLDTENGDGFFAVGNVVQPAILKTTSLMPNTVDDAFPVINFHFEGGHSLSLFPHDYLLRNESDWYFVALWNGRSQNEDWKDMVVFGDIALSNKLVIYDLGNQVVGWADQDCSINIKMEDED